MTTWVATAPARARRVETAALALLALLLTAALLNDVVRQLGIDRRLKVDERTFARYYPGVSRRQMDPIAGKRGKPDLVCARPVAGAGYKVCLIMAGTSHVRYRSVVGAYSVPTAHHDRRRYRFDCHGYAVSKALCPPA